MGGVGEYENPTEGGSDASSVTKLALDVGDELVRIFGRKANFMTLYGRRPGSMKNVPLLVLIGPKINGSRGYLLDKCLPILQAWPESKSGEEEADLGVLGDALEEAAFAGEAKDF